MNNNRKTKGQPSKPSPSTPPKDSPSSGVFSLRLPTPLRVAADKYASSTGVSLNGLVCIALADYLASRGHQVKS